MELFIGGGIILVYVGLVIACMLWTLSWARRKGFGWKGKTAAVLVVLIVAYAVPFGDHTVGLLRFEQLCDEYAGARIKETVENVDGFIWETERLSQPDTHGYSFYETKTHTNDIFRYVRRENGASEEMKVDRPKARYLVRRNPRSTLSGHITKSEFVILELETSRTLASYTTLHYQGGWLIRDLGGIGISGPTCPRGAKVFEPTRFVQSILIPSR